MHPEQWAEPTLSINDGITCCVHFIAVIGDSNEQGFTHDQEYPRVDPNEVTQPK